MTMMHLIKLSLSLILFVASVQPGLFQGHVDDQELYAKIDEYLNKQVKSDDPETNIAAVAKWLDKEEKSCLWFGGNSKLNKALAQFNELKSIVDSGECDADGEKVVDDNDWAAKRPREHVAGLSMDKRVQKVVHYYAKKYYEKCKPDIISPLFDKLSSENYRYALKLSNYAVPSDDLTNPEQYVSLLRLHTNQPEFSAVSESDFNKYIVEPCRELEQQMGPEFQTEVNIWFQKYDASLDEQGQIRGKRVAVKHCQVVLQVRDKIWQDILGFISNEKANHEKKVQRRQELEEKLRKPKPKPKLIQKEEEEERRGMRAARVIPLFG